MTLCLPSSLGCESHRGRGPPCLSRQPKRTSPDGHEDLSAPQTVLVLRTYRRFSLFPSSYLFTAFLLSSQYSCEIGLIVSLARTSPEPHRWSKSGAQLRRQQAENQCLPPLGLLLPLLNSSVWQVPSPRTIQGKCFVLGTAD